jgi:hypothetical protein
MAYVKIEPSGCGVSKKGMVEIRFAMYLEPQDYGYDMHHILINVVSDDENMKNAKKMNDTEYAKWTAALPKEWVDNPFHNHFIQVPPELSDGEIMDIGEAFLHEAYIEWATEGKIILSNRDLLFDKEIKHDELAVLERVKQVKMSRSMRKMI